jgi:hypothetical protein
VPTYLSIICSVLLVGCFASGALFIDEGTAVWTDAHHARGVATVSDSNCSLNADETETQCDVTVTHKTRTDNSVTTPMTRGFNLILLIAA